jgi:hypothetical protein
MIVNLPVNIFRGMLIKKAPITLAGGHRWNHTVEPFYDTSFNVPYVPIQLPCPDSTSSAAG